MATAKKTVAATTATQPAARTGKQAQPAQKQVAQAAPAPAQKQTAQPRVAQRTNTAQSNNNTQQQAVQPQRQVAKAAMQVAQPAQAQVQQSMAGTVSPTGGRPGTASDAARELFKEHIGMRDTHGDTAFRRFIFETLETEYGVTHSSACSMYNMAKKYWTEVEPELTVNLGRPPERNNGGPKPSVYYVVADANGVAATEAMSRNRAEEQRRKMGQGFQVMLAPEQETA